MGLIAPILMVGWTLSYEMFFYLLFAIALSLKIRPIRFLIPCMIALSCVGVFYRESWPTLMVLLKPISLEFLGGVLLAHVVTRRIRWNPILVSVIGLLGLMVTLALARRTHLRLARILVQGDHVETGI
jgi:peptidoglycan/LPS O-acetylase OafA/YrhL